MIMKNTRQTLLKIPLYLSLGFLIASLLWPAFNQAPVPSPALFIDLILFIEFGLLIFIMSISFAFFKKPLDLIIPALATFLLLVYLFVGLFQIFMDNQQLAHILDILILLIIPQAVLAFDF